MARTPRASAPSPKKAAPRKRGPVEGVQIDTLVNNSSVKVTRTTMQPGAEIPQQGRGSDYVIFPITEYSCARRFMRGNKISREVPLEGVPGRPYFARATRAGAEFVLVNHGSSVAVFDKVVLKRPREE